MKAVAFCLGLIVIVFGRPEAAAQPGSSVAATPPLASGRSLADPSTITTGDVLARALLLRENVGLIRRYMGLPSVPEPLFRAKNATMGEVFFNALALGVRTRQLAFEQLRTARPGVPKFPESQVAAADVLRRLDETLSMVLRVKRALGITIEPPERPQPDDTSPTTLFNVLLEITQEIVPLIEESVLGANVYAVVTILVHQAMRLHRMLTSRMMPDEPPIEPNKTNEDIFDEMMRCFERVSKLLRANGLPVLDIERVTDRQRKTTSSDLIDLSVLMIAEMDRMIMALGKPREVLPPLAPGRKYPSDIVPRVKLLGSVLDDILASKKTAKKKGKPR